MSFKIYALMFKKVSQSSLTGRHTPNPAVKANTFVATTWSQLARRYTIDSMGVRMGIFATRRVADWPFLPPFLSISLQK